jgi:hypothetical protein
MSRYWIYKNAVKVYVDTPSTGLRNEDKELFKKTRMVMTLDKEGQPIYKKINKQNGR